MSENCPICLGSEFREEENSRICIECGHQSSYYAVLERGDVVDASRLYTSVLTIDHSSEINPENFPHAEEYEMMHSSYEAFNVILKKWTDALQHLGASPKIKETISTLWFLYLNKRKIAFIKDVQSETDFAGSSFQVVHEGDKEYNKSHAKNNKEPIPEKKKKAKKAPSKEEKMKSKMLHRRFAGTLTQKRVTHELSQYVNEDDLDGTLKMEVVSDEEEISEIPQDSLFEDESKNCSDDDDAESPQKDSADANQYQTMIFKYSRSPYHLTLDKLVSFLYLGILLSQQEDIFLSDLIRWCKEGLIPYDSAMYLLNQNMKIDKKDRWLFQPISISHRSICEHAGLFAWFLSLQAVPLPPFEYIVSKYALALGLPDDIKPLIITILYKLGIQRHSWMSLPPVELYVAAAIVLVFKITYGLDDYQELLTSKAADDINSLLKKGHSNHRVFSWTKWQIYVNSLLHVVKKINPLQSPHQESTSDANITINNFWATDLWNYPKSNAESKVMSSKWKLTNMVLKLTDLNLEDAINTDRFVKGNKIPFMGVIDDYIKSCQLQESFKGNGTLLEVTKKLKNSSFSNTKFDWVNHDEDVVTNLELVNQFISLQKISVLSNKIISGGDQEDSSSMAKNISVPLPCECFWMLNHHYVDKQFKIDTLPDSFLWLLKVFQEMLNCSLFDLLHHIYMFEAKYITRKKSVDRRSLNSKMSPK